MTKIAICLILAAILGAFIGWQLRNLINRHRSHDLQKDLNAATEQAHVLEQERDALFLKLERLERDNIDLNHQLMSMPPTRDSGPIEGLDQLVTRLQRLEETSQALKTRVDGIDHNIGSYPLLEIEGLAAEELPLFKRMDINNTHQLIEYGATDEGRNEIAEKTGISVERIGKMASIADLLRVPGITGSIANLIVAAGIRSAPHLAEQKPYKFALKLKEVNAEKQLLSTCPGASIISHWIEEAGKLDASISN